MPSVPRLRRMPEDLFIAFYHKPTGRHAVLEDDGLTAWLYLHAPSNDPHRTAAVEKACFVYNRKAPIDTSETTKHRPKPPAIDQHYASESAITENPASHDWTIQWSLRGEAVLLTRDGQPWCLIEVSGGNNRGHCKSIRAEGPWGSPWDQQKFHSTKWE